jgi:hypothetical protein
MRICVGDLGRWRAFTAPAVEIPKFSGVPGRRVALAMEGEQEAGREGGAIIQFLSNERPVFAHEEKVSVKA